MSSANLLEIDELTLLFGDDYVINNKIRVAQPKVGDIVVYGEREYYSMLSSITAIPSEMKANLADMGIDWCQITDFQLAMMIWPSIPQDKTKILFGDLDFQKLKPVENLQNGEIVLRDSENDIVIDELIYGRIFAFLCSVHNLTKKVEKAANEFTKKFMIDEDRQKMLHNSKQPYKSFLLPIISAVKVRQGYTLEYVKNMHIWELMNEINRLQIIVQTDALLQGSYSGMVDTSKIPKSSFDWTRPIEIEKKGAMALS